MLGFQTKSTTKYLCSTDTSD